MSLFDKSPPDELRGLAAALLTTTYVASTTIDVSTHSMVTLEIVYGPEDGTGVEVLPEVLRQGADADDDDWAPAASVLSAGTPAAGAVASELLAGSVVLAVGGSRIYQVPVYGATRFRVRCRELGSPASPGQCLVYAIRSRVGV